MLLSPFESDLTGKGTSDNLAVRAPNTSLFKFLFASQPSFCFSFCRQLQDARAALHEVKLENRQCCFKGLFFSMRSPLRLICCPSAPHF